MNESKHYRICVVVEACQWDGTVDDAETLIKWVFDNNGHAKYHKSSPNEESHIVVDTPLAEYPDCVIYRGDWLVLGIHGFFRKEHDEFSATSEVVAVS